MNNVFIIERLGKRRYEERLAESERLNRWLPEVKKLRARHKLRQAIRRIVAQDDASRLLDELPTLVHEARERLRPRATCRTCGAPR